MYLTTSYLCNTDQTKSFLQRKFPDLWIYISFFNAFYVHLQPIIASMLNNFCFTPSIKKQAHQDGPCTLQNCVNWNSKTLILSLKNNNYSDFAYCQGGKTICSIWKFDMPSCSSCRLCTALILDPATKTDCFLCKQIVF